MAEPINNSVDSNIPTPPPSPPPPPPPSSPPTSTSTGTGGNMSGDTFVVKSEPKKKSFIPQISSGTKPLLLSAMILFLVVAGAAGVFIVQTRWAPKEAAVKTRLAPKRTAEGDTCQYCEHCENSSQKLHQCTGTIQGGVCKYNPSVPPNCTACKSCGNGTCDPCEDSCRCPADCHKSPYCPSALGKEPGCGGFTNPDPNCGSQVQGGVYCHDSLKAYCCYNQNGNLDDGYEYCAGPGDCKDLGNGSICVKNGWSGTIFKIVGNNVTCPYSGPETNVFSGTVQDGTASCGDFTGQVFSLSSEECGQIDGPCGSCRPGCTMLPSPTPTPTGIACNEITLSCSPSQASVGETVTFSISGDASTWTGDTWTPGGMVTGGGDQCSCTTVGDTGNGCGFYPSKTCQARDTAGTYTWTHYWKRCVGSTENCSTQCSKSIVCGIEVIPPPSPTPTSTLTPTPTPTTAYCACAQAKVYDTFWAPIETSRIQAGQSYRFAVKSNGVDVTKARLRINSGADSSWCDGSGREIVDSWCEMTVMRSETNEFWIEYPIPINGGTFTIEAEVACPTGWK